jgi:lactate dehydrogenase-like 2-hydroxyacid dehydrogenase
MPDVKPIVLVTTREYLKSEEYFLDASDVQCRPSPDDEEKLAEAIRHSGAKYVIVGNRQYVGPLYDAVPAGGVIARFGVGHDGIDKARATARHILCTNTPGVLDQSVAEHAMLLVAAASRNLTAAIASMTSGMWISPAGRDLQGKRIAIIGCGGIGRAVARIASLGYGMRVVGCTKPGTGPAFAEGFGAAGTPALEYFDHVTNDFAAAVRDADFVSLHIPARADTAGFINRERLSQMNSDAWLINTARGAVVDEAALFTALAAGRLAGAALDVFAREPYEPVEGSPDLRRLPNVILTPHVGSNTVESNRRMAERALQNVRFAVSGQLDRMDVVSR